jgi:hypothetical protein
MKISWIVVPLVAMGLSGCAAQLSHQAREKLKADCAARGMQFVETGSKQTELLVAGQSEVSGECVGPGDPRYVAPQKS